MLAAGRFRAAAGVLIAAALVSACAVRDTEPADERGIPGVWDIEFFDRDRNGLGSIRIALTNEPVDDQYCGEPFYRKAVILEDELDFDIGMEKRPAYSISFFWLKLDLTASVCHTNFLLMGNIDPTQASGFFTYAHPLGGEYLGRFTALPVDSGDSD
jgi:hypothetical protein